MFQDEQEFKYRIPLFRGVNQEIDEQNLEPADSPFAYGYDTDDGNLSTVKAHDIASLPIDRESNQIRALNGVPIGNRLENLMVYYKYNTDTGDEDGYLIAQTNYIDGKSHLYYIKLFGQDVNWTFLAQSEDTYNAFANYRYQGEDIFIFGNPKEYLRQWNGESVTVLGAGTEDNPPKLGSLIVHYERLWGTVMTPDVFRVWYSTDHDPTNWTIGVSEAGFEELIDQSGKNVTILSAFDSILVFKRYGVKRITGVYPGEFYGSDLFNTSSAIEPHTVADCINTILYTASDGIYAFDGTSATIISAKVQKYFSNVSDIRKARAVFFDNKYIVALPVQYPDEEVPQYNNTVIEYNFTTQSFRVLKDVFVNSFLVLRLHNYEKLVYATNGVNIKEYAAREKLRL